MRKVLISAALAGAVALSACSSQADRTAAQLDDAAAQSEPAGAAVLANEADALRNDEGAAASTADGMSGQAALENAAAAQAGTPPAPQR